MRVRSSSHRTLAVSCLQKNTTLGRCGRIVLIFIMVALLIESLRPRLVYDFSQGVVKLPPARGSGSVVGVTGACVCDGSGVKRPGDRLGDRPGLLRLPLRPALLLLACARAGNQDQRRQEPPRQVPERGQPRRAGPAHGGHGRAPQRDLHRRQAPRKARPNGHPRRDQGDRPRTRLPDLPHGDRRPRIRRAGHRRLREAAPQQEVRSVPIRFTHTPTRGRLCT